MAAKESPTKANSRARLVRLAALALAAAVVIVAIWSWRRERMVARAEKALQEGNLEQALHLTEEFLAQHPDHRDALAVRARALIAQQHPQPVRQGIAIMEQIGPATVADLHALARAYMLYQKWSKAVSLLSGARRLHPDNEDLLYDTTTCQVHLSLLGEALVSAEKFAALKGNEARGSLIVASIYQDLGLFPEAARAYARVLKFAPDAENEDIPSEEVFLQYGSALMNIGRFRQAVSLLKRSLAERPTAQAHYLLGNAMSQSGQWEAAVTQWNNALRLEPSHDRAREALANDCLQRGGAEAALTWLIPLEVSPALSSRAASLLERAYAGEGNHDLASQWRRRAAELRLHEERKTAITNIVNTMPYSYPAKVIKAHGFARQRNWSQAAVYLPDLKQRQPLDPFVADLVKAINDRGVLPSIDRLSLEQFATP